MGYLNNVYAQNWIEQLRTNHERFHPERDARERMARVDRRRVDVFYWGDTNEGDSLWRKRDTRMYPEFFELIR